MFCRPLWPCSDNAPWRTLMSSRHACHLRSVRMEMTLGAVMFSLVTYHQFYTIVVMKDVYKLLCKIWKFHLKKSLIPVICDNSRTNLPFLSQISLDYFVTCLYTVHYYMSISCIYMKVLRLNFKCSTPGKTKTVKVILPSKYMISNSFHCVCVYTVSILI